MASQIVVSKTPKEAIIEQEPRYGMYVRSDLAENERTSWAQVRRILHSRWKIALAFVVGLEAILLVLVLLLHNKYEAHAILEISPATADSLAMKDASSSQTTPAQQDYLDTQNEILRSDYLALKVIRDQHLDQNPTFYSPSFLQRAMSRVASLIPGTSEKADGNQKIDALLRSFRDGLSITQIKNSRLVDASFESRDPQLSTDITNSLVRLYLDDAHRSKYESTLKAAESLAPELKELKDSVDNTNRSLIDFQKTHEGTELANAAPAPADASGDSGGGGGISNPVASRVAQLNQQLTQSIGDRVQQESFIHLINEGRNDVLPQMKDSPLIQDLTKRLVESRAQLAQALAVYGGNNPQVRKLQEQTSELNTQLNAERTRIADQIKASYQSAKVRENLLRNQLHTLKGQLDSSNANVVQFDMLRREAQAQSSLYLATSSKIKEMAVAGSLASNNLRVLDEARIPVRPSSPHRLQILGGGLFLGLLGGVVLAFIAEGMDDTISSLDDVRKFSGMPALALLPASAQAPRLRNGRVQRGYLGQNANGFSVPVLQFLKEMPNSPEAEAIRSLETAIRIAAQADDRPLKTVLITSAFPGEGKTTVATNLAAALSKHNKTCLIDADLRHPVITPTYGLSRRVGLQDALVRPDLVDQLGSAPDNPNLTVLGAGISAPNAIEKVSSEAMATLVEKLKAKFDYVVIDSPPLIPFAESRWLSTLADGIVVVARCRTTTRRAMSWTMDMLGDVQSKVLGVVLNGVNLESEYYAYGSSYHYDRARTA
jgi:polysaccharide biosynthesis transport protein